MIKRKPLHWRPDLTGEQLSDLYLRQYNVRWRVNQTIRKYGEMGFRLTTQVDVRKVFISDLCESLRYEGEYPHRVMVRDIGVRMTRTPNSRQEICSPDVKISAALSISASLVRQLDYFVILDLSDNRIEISIRYDEESTKPKRQRPKTKISKSSLRMAPRPKKAIIVNMTEWRKRYTEIEANEFSHYLQSQPSQPIADPKP